MPVRDEIGLKNANLFPGIFCLLTAPAYYISPTVVIVFAILGKFCICITYAIIYQLAGELFPTVARGLGIGFGSVVGNAIIPW